MKSIPHRCEACIEESSYTGFLVFGDAKPPQCKTHHIPLTPVPDYEALRRARGKVA